jgi:hypothetical protein
MNKRQRDRLADDAAMLWALRNGANGCLVPMVVVCVVLLMFVRTAMAVFAQASPSDGYPQAAYTLPDPETEARLTLATQAGRWTVEPDDASCIAPFTQVWLTAPVDVAHADLVAVDDGRHCTLDPTVRIFRQQTPCAQRDGECDVSREPTPQWWELP